MKINCTKSLRFVLILLLGMAAQLHVAGQSRLIGSDTLRIFNGGRWGVFDTMRFASGMVVTTRTNNPGQILFTRDGGYSNATAISHVDGYAAKTGVLPYTFKFPIGHKGKLKPCDIEAFSGGSDSTFNACYYFENPINATIPSGPMNIYARHPNILTVSPVQYWDINGTGMAKITLFWEATDNLVATTNNNITDLVIAGWNGTVWAPLGKVNTTGALAGTGSVTSSDIFPSTYFAYTFALYNRIPKIENQDTFTNEDQTIQISTRLSGKDGSRDTIDYSFCKLPVNGIISLINDTAYKYSPYPNFNGKDSFCIKICDKVGNCDIKVIHIDVFPVNDTPIIGNNEVFLDEDDSVLICPSIYDPDKFDQHKAFVICGPSHGKGIQVSDTCIRYKPDQDYNGKDTFCFMMCDQVNACDTIQIFLTIFPLYDSLQFKQDPVLATENVDSAFIPYKYDPDSDTVLMAFCNGKDNTLTNHGKAIITKNKFVTYTPNVNYAGFDTICLIACTKNAPIKCKSIKVPILVLDGRKIVVNLNDDIYTIETDYVNLPFEADTTIKGILTNDIIVPFTNQIQINSEPFSGKLNRFPNYVQYYPYKDFEGRDSFQYSLCIQGICDTAWVKLYVSRVYMNLITPNGDGKNDHFELPILESYKNAKVTIFNRWGDMVWVSVGEYKTNKFDGKSKDGSILPDGTYYYVIKFNDPNKEDKADFLEIMK